MLATAVSNQPFEWEQHLRRLCHVYNTSVHPTIGFSPFFLMFGRQARMPVDVMLGTTTTTPCTIPEYDVTNLRTSPEYDVTNLCTSLEKAYEYVRKRMGHQLEQQKDHYDVRSHGKAFEAGDLVWLHNPAVPRARSKKLHRPWTGPYHVMSKLSEAMHRLQHTQCSRKRPVVHFDRLKPCSPTTRLPQASRRRPQLPQSSSHQSSTHSPVGAGLELVDDVVEHWAPTADRPTQRVDRGLDSHQWSILSPRQLPPPLEW